MLGGQSLYAGTPAWLLAFVSFVIAVIIVSLLEVGVIEFLYIRFKKSIKSRFNYGEKYYESRFMVDANIDSNVVISSLMKKFDLTSERRYSFEDIYYKSKLINFNGRTGKVRRRTIFFPEETIHKYQITYTKAGEIPQNVLSQYRFFINLKEKFSAIVNEGEQIDSKHFNTNIHSTVRFSRHSAANKEGIYAAMDKVTSSNSEDYQVVELKVFEDKKLLESAMKFIMGEFNVIQTTQSKIDL